MGGYRSEVQPRKLHGADEAELVPTPLGWAAGLHVGATGVRRGCVLAAGPDGARCPATSIRRPRDCDHACDQSRSTMGLIPPYGNQQMEEEQARNARFLACLQTSCRSANLHPGFKSGRRLQNYMVRVAAGRNGADRVRHLTAACRCHRARASRRSCSLSGRAGCGPRGSDRLAGRSRIRAPRAAQ